jgi:alcohol dehydrogenase class IV
MCFADTLGGMCIANVGTVLPHAMGQPISGHCPHVSHGESLAVVYPAFFRYTWSSSVERFARVARILNPELEEVDDRTAAERSCEEMEDFLDSLGLLTTLDELDVPEEEMEGILDHCMEFPDLEGNPKVPGRDKVEELFEECR